MDYTILVNVAMISNFVYSAIYAFEYVDRGKAGCAWVSFSCFVAGTALLAISFTI